MINFYFEFESLEASGMVAFLRYTVMDPPEMEMVLLFLTF
jgi:hypothetical protein